MKVKVKVKGGVSRGRYRMATVPLFVLQDGKKEYYRGMFALDCRIKSFFGEADPRRSGCWLSVYPQLVSATHVQAKFSMFLVPHSVINNTAIIQPSIPPTFPPGKSSSVVIIPSNELVIYAGTIVLQILHPGYKSFPSTLTIPLQS